MGDTFSMAEENEKIVVTRIDKSLRTRLSDLAEKRNTTIVSLLNNSVIDYLEENEYDFNDFMNVVEKNNSLIVYKDLIKNEMSTCPNQVCKNLIDTIEDKDVQIFQESLDSIAERLEEIETKNIHSIFLVAKFKEFEINKVNKVIGKFKDFSKFNKVEIKFTATNAEKDGILAFVSYKKEDGENGKRI